MQRVELGELEYEVAAKEMRGWVEERVAGAAEDRLFLLSHPPVITYGPRTALDDLPAETAGIPAVGSIAVGSRRTTGRDSWSGIWSST